METVVSHVPQALAVIGGLWLAYLAFVKVFVPIVEKGFSFVTVAKKDFAAVEARVSALEVDLHIKAAPTGPTGAAKPAPAAALSGATGGAA